MNNTKLLLSFALTTGSLIFCTANQDWTKNQTIYRKFLEDIVHNCDKYDKQTSHYHTGFLSMLTPAEAVTVLTHNEKDIINLAKANHCFNCANDLEAISQKLSKVMKRTDIEGLTLFEIMSDKKLREEIKSAN